MTYGCQFHIPPVGTDIPLVFRCYPPVILAATDFSAAADSCGATPQLQVDPELDSFRLWCADGAGDWAGACGMRTGACGREAVAALRHCGCTEERR